MFWGEEIFSLPFAIFAALLGSIIPYINTVTSTCFRTAVAAGGAAFNTTTGGTATGGTATGGTATGGAAIAVTVTVTVTVRVSACSGAGIVETNI